MYYVILNFAEDTFRRIRLLLDALVDCGLLFYNSREQLYQIQFSVHLVRRIRVMTLCPLKINKYCCFICKYRFLPFFSFDLLLTRTLITNHCLFCVWVL